MRDEYGEALEFDERVLVVLTSTAALSERREVTLARSRIERMLRGKEDGIVDEAFALAVRGGYTVIEGKWCGLYVIQ